MKDSVKKAVADYGMILKGDNIIVALSGGADSVSLLYTLNELKDELGFSLSACHVDHNLRGAESDRDRAFAKSLCEKLSVPVSVFSVDVKGTVKKHQSIEERARELRYEIFGRLAKENGAKIATAHNANDNAETVLLNLLRGTGLKGLCGIPPVRDYLIRPLIYTPRAAIEAFCRENHIEYVTDRTNFSTDYTRNKIRLDILPRLTEINPSLIDGIARMTGNLTEDSVFLEKLALDAKNKAQVAPKKYDCRLLSDNEPCVLHRAVSLILRESDVEPTHLRITGISKIISENHGKINIEKNKFAVAKKGIFEIQTVFQNYRQKNT